MQKINELQLAKELIRFPSVTKTDAGVVKFLEKKLKKIGFKTKILEFKDKNSYPVKNLNFHLFGISNFEINKLNISTFPIVSVPVEYLIF